MKTAAAALLRPATIALFLWSCGEGDATDPAPDPAIAISLSQPSIAITQGQQSSASLSITRTNFTGAITVSTSVAHDGVTMTASPGSVSGNLTTLTVSAAGYTEPGTINTTITATGSGVASQSTTLAVIVSKGPLNATSDPLRVEPGRVWRFRGSQATSLTASVDGVNASVTYEGDSVALVAVPALPAFVPCMALDTLPVFLATATGSVHLEVPGEALMRPNVAVGGRRSLDATLVRGCRTELPAGKFLLVAAVPDSEPFVVEGQLRPDSGTLQLDLATAGAMVASGNPMPLALEPLSLDATQMDTRHGRRMEQRSSGTIVAHNVVCDLLSEVGDSIMIPTRRDAQGRFRWSSTSDPGEWWYLISRTPHVDVVVDSGGRRIWAEDSFMRTNVGQVLALYDTAWVPVWAELYAAPLPDRDANGRMIWFAPWNSGEGGGGGTGWYLQSGCTNNERAGENFYGPLDMFSSDTVRTRPYLAAYYRETIFHEASHTHDLSRRATAHGRWFQWPPGTQVATEGIPVFVTEYWNLKRTGAPLTGNHTTVTPSTDGIVHPGLLWEMFPKIVGNYHWDTWSANGGYKQSGRFILWVVAQAVRQGRPLSQALTTLATSTRATYGSIYRAATNSTMSNRDVLMAWLNSWYVDDRVAGIDQLINYTPWNTVSAYASRSLIFPLPTAALTGSGSWSVLLGDPDAKFIELTTNESTWLSAKATGALRPRVSLELLRLQ